MKKLIFTLLSGALLTTAVAQTTSTRYAATITPEDLKQMLTYIAGPETEGRESGTIGQRRAAAYIENKFRQLGLRPGTAAGYQQVFGLYQDTLLELTFKVNGTAYALNNDIAVSVASLPSHYTTADQVVFAGYGIEDSTRSDYQGLDLKDKWVVLLQGRPAGSPALSPMQNALSNEAKLRAARSKGAKGIIIVSRDFPRNQPIATKSNKYLNRRPASVPMFTVSPAVASALLGRQVSFDELANVPKGVYNTNLQTSSYKYSLRFPSTNVIGILPGTDKADEYLFITAHYDHEGIKDGKIYYGADDDGSGTVAVMELAEAFAQAKANGQGPRRSIVFMTVSAEEMGLLGSDFYARNPTVPLAKTTADLNIDMIGRIDPTFNGDSTNYVYVIGDDRLSSDLAPITDSANRNVNLVLDRRFNGNDPQRFYFRSDHYNFAKNGVPIIFYFNGTHADYHRPTDTVDKINFPLMTKRARLVFHTAWIMANREDMLKRDIPLRAADLTR